jgi:hypothetical protein
MLIGMASMRDFDVVGVEASRVCCDLLISGVCRDGRQVCVALLVERTLALRDGGRVGVGSAMARAMTEGVRIVSFMMVSRARRTVREADRNTYG